MVTRGEVRRARFSSKRGREQFGARYAVVLQADAMGMHSTVVVAPTSRSATVASFRPKVDVRGKPTLVMVEQLRALDHRRLGDSVGQLTPAELGEVDDALRLVLAL